MPENSDPSANQQPIKNRNIKRLIVSDPSLRGFSGHYYEYARAVGSAATRLGIESALFGNNAFTRTSSTEIVPHFRLQTYDLIDSRLPTPIRILLSARVHSKDIKRLLREHSLGNSDLVLMPTVSIPVLFGLLLAFGFAFRRGNSPIIAVVLRDTMKIHRPAVKTLTSLFFKLAKFTRAANWLKICVDTDELRDEYSTITSFPISVLPIPIERETIEQFDIPSSNDKLTISMLGDARLGKGIDLIPDLVEEMLAQYPNQLKFIIQTSTPVVGADSDLLETTLVRLNQLKQEHAELVLLPEPLTTQEYFSTIAQSDIMLHPYRAESYRYQSSGMFAEAMALGKVVIVPGNTWMSSELEKASGGGAIFEAGEADSLSAATRTVIDNIETYRHQAHAAQVNWKATHNSDAVVAELIRALTTGATS